MWAAEHGGTCSFCEAQPKCEISFKKRRCSPEGSSQTGPAIAVGRWIWKEYTTQKNCEPGLQMLHPLRDTGARWVPGQMNGSTRWKWDLSVGSNIRKYSFLLCNTLQCDTQRFGMVLERGLLSIFPSQGKLQPENKVWMIPKDKPHCWLQSPTWVIVWEAEGRSHVFPKRLALHTKTAHSSLPLGDG